MLLTTKHYKVDFFGLKYRPEYVLYKQTKLPNNSLLGLTLSVKPDPRIHTSLMIFRSGRVAR